MNKRNTLQAIACIALLAAAIALVASRARLLT